MSKKHFVAIAARIKREREFTVAMGQDTTAFDTLVRALCGEFKAINFAFDRDRFLTACGVPE